MTEAELSSYVIAHGGFVDAAEAARAVDAVLAVLGERLGRPEAGALADALPPSWAAPLQTAGFDRAFDADELCARVAARQGIALGFAREQATVVARAVASALSDEALARLRRALSPDLGALFARPEATPAPEHAILARGRTLADGRPGSRHPLSEAAPRAAQSDSVARAANPHADTKLSSARGLTQEREDESLATGQVRTRPLSEGKE